MSQIPCKHSNASGRLIDNARQNHNIYPQVRGRSRNRQFRLMSTSGALETGDDVSASAPTFFNIAVPSHMSSETPVLSSPTNVTSLNVVSKSSAPLESFNSHELDNDPHFPELESWIEQPHSTWMSSTKRCQSKPAKSEKPCTKQKGIETLQSKKSCQPCKFPQHDVSWLKQRLVKYRAETESCGDAAKLNGQLNEIFVQRLVDIENAAKGDTDTKLITYQEWVDMLMQINEIIIGSMTDLESEVAERLESMKRRIKSSCSQTINLEQKYRQDICSLMKLLKNAYHYDNWDIRGLEFQTVNLNDILGSRNATRLDPEHSNITKEIIEDQDSGF